MHEYDVTLKLILQSATVLFTQEVVGEAVVRWHNVELPEIQQTCVDLLGETGAGSLLHIELQSSNDPAMAVRMLEYSARVYRLWGRLPRQIVLYVGQAPLRMESALGGDRLSFSFEQIDVRDLDSSRPIESAALGNNIMAILTRIRNKKEAFRRVLGRIGSLHAGERDLAFRQLLIWAGLRRLGQLVVQEAEKMPILNDLMDHDVIGPAIRRGLEEGIRQGREEGMHQGELALLQRQMTQRFGTLPE